MKKILTAMTLILFTSCATWAEGSMGLPDVVNSHIFSTEATKPLMNLERTHYTNRAIMQMGTSQEPEKEVSANVKEEEVIPVEKTRFKDLFKGFVVEW